MEKWVTGEPITASKMNQIGDSIDNANTIAIEALQTANSTQDENIRLKNALTQVTTLTGNPIVITNALAMTPNNITIEITPAQDGIPTPSAPIDINSYSMIALTRTDGTGGNSATRFIDLDFLAGGSVYGGEIVLNEDGTNTLSITWAKKTLAQIDADGGGFQYYVKGTNPLFRIQMPGRKVDTNVEGFCNAYDFDRSAKIDSLSTNVPDKCFGYQITYPFIVFRNDDYRESDYNSQADMIAAWLSANADTYVVYELETPIEIPINIMKLSLLEGENQLSNDCDLPMQLTYYIDKYAEESVNARVSSLEQHFPGTGRFTLGNGMASVNYAVAEGFNTQATNSFSHAEGFNTQATGYASHSEGSNAIASGSSSHAEGRGQATGPYSHAEGNNAYAQALCSHAEGLGTQARAKSQHVFGEYNTPDVIAIEQRGNYVEIVGNGNSSNTSNARTLDWYGNEQLAGGLTLNAWSPNALALTPPLIQTWLNNLSREFTLNNTYEVGEYVRKDGALYICTTAVEEAETWDETKWRAVTFGGEVTGLKSALSNTTGSEIVSNWTSGYYATSSSVTNVDVTSITPSARYRCTYVSCNPGDVFIYTGTGTLSARPWAFLKANGDIVGTKGASGAHTNERIIAPANSAKVVFNADVEATFLVCKGDYVITKVNNNANSINSIDSRLLQTNVNIPWEIGNIAFDTTPTYKYDRSTRVRTPQGYALRLNAGDVVGMKSYTNAGFYVGWYDDNNSFHYTSAKYADYTITQNGNYIFLLRNVTEVSQGGDAYSLGNLFFVHSKTNADEVYAETLEYTGRAIAQNESGLNYHLFKQAKPRFAMHRGYSTLAPENTVPAFELAGQNGAWGIETDIYETTDGHFVCFHDETVDRMTDGTGDIADMTLSQVEALTIDSGANIEQYPNLKIPTLETFLSICRRYGCVGLIEIKSVINYDDLCELIRSKGLENGVILLIGTAIKAPILRYYTKSVIAALGYSSTVAIDLINSVCTFENMAVDFDATTINDSTGIDAAHEKNLPVIVWTTDTESRADELFRLGVDVVTTNSIPAFSMG